MVFLSILVLTLDNFVGSECLVLTHSHTGSFAQNSFQVDLFHAEAKKGASEQGGTTNENFDKEMKNK